MKGRKMNLAAFAVIALMSISLLAVSADAQRRTRTTRPAPQVRVITAPPAVLSNVDTLVTIRRKGVLNVGFATFVPWAMRDKDGNYFGFEIDVAKKLAEDLGVELKLMPAGSSALIGDLMSKRFDILITGMYPTPQRALLVNFSEPYSKSKIELIASRDKMRGKGDEKDYNDEDVTIGVVSGTVYDELAKARFPKAKIQYFDDEAAMMEAVGEGKINAAMASTPGPEFAMKHGGARIFRPLADPMQTMDESFVIRKGDVDFLNYLNTWIRYYERNGWLKERRKYWFEDTDWADRLQ
ncbi:MAG: transporter substrate-binding domain-containing protein [Acidobacteria bacterium]|nr:transporter substrate-binding domain-containing protein [Acidobacteriota bacterium]